MNVIPRKRRAGVRVTRVADETIGNEPGLNPWLRVRRYLLITYCGVLVLIVSLVGIPTGRASLMTIVIAGLAVNSLGNGWRRLSRVALDWLPFTLVLMVYDLSRGLANAMGMPLHERDIASAEQWLFNGNIPAVWLQQHLYDATAVHWYDALATLVYTTHFLVTPILAAVLWLRNRPLWIGYIARIAVLSFLGLVTYVLFPEAPPWLAARDGLIDPVSRLSARGWIWLHAGNLHEILASAQRDGPNPVAAMPSMHTSVAVLAALFLGAHLTGRWRYLLALYPVAMGLVLVYTGEHYVLDVVIGAGYAVAAHMIVSRWERGRAELAADVEREPVAVA
jgi:membrane-associated phospholipid phosphatase